MTSSNKIPCDLRIHLVQMSSSPELDSNLIHCRQIIKKAVAEGNDLIIFPECALTWAKTEITHKLAKMRTAWIDLLAQESKNHSISIIWGGLAEREGDKVFNSSFIFDCDGSLLAVYRKTHLFQIFASDSLSVDETKTYTHGNTGPVIIKIKGWSLGISICYDLRFPEFLRSYAGCDLIVNTAAFTRRTGRAHWEVLMRARAIENQCYLIGSCQTGVNKLSGISAYGHSMLIDAWGEVLCDLESEVKSQSLSLPYNSIEKTRALVPALYTSFPHLREN